MAEKKKRNHRRLGSVYEQTVGFYLEQYGYEIVAFNYRCPMGEIDLIAQRGRSSRLLRGEIPERSTLRKRGGGCGSEKTEADLEVCALLSYRAWDRGCAVSV